MQNTSPEAFSQTFRPPTQAAGESREEYEARAAKYQGTLSPDCCYNPLIARMAFAAGEVRPVELNAEYFGALARLREAMLAGDLVQLVDPLFRLTKSITRYGVSAPDLLQLTGMFQGCSWLTAGTDSYPQDIICPPGAVPEGLYRKFPVSGERPKEALAAAFAGAESVATRKIPALGFAKNPFATYLRRGIDSKKGWDLGVFDRMVECLHSPEFRKALDKLKRTPMRRCAYEHCGKEFVPRRPNNVYCSNQCRTYADRQRKTLRETEQARRSV